MKAKTARANTTDELFLRASPDVVQRALLDITQDSSWWPGARASGDATTVRLSIPVGTPFARTHFSAAVSNIRDTEGFTWMLEAGELRGRAEWWLEPFKRGTIAHYFLDVERAPGGRRRLSARVRRHRWAMRRGVNALKDQLEGRA